MTANLTPGFGKSGVACVRRLSELDLIVADRLRSSRARPDRTHMGFDRAGAGIRDAGVPTESRGPAFASGRLALSGFSAVVEGHFVGSRDFVLFHEFTEVLAIDVRLPRCVGDVVVVGAQQVLDVVALK